MEYLEHCEQRQCVIGQLSDRSIQDATWSKLLSFQRFCMYTLCQSIMEIMRIVIIMEQDNGETVNGTNSRMTSVQWKLITQEVLNHNMQTQ